MGVLFSLRLELLFVLSYILDYPYFHVHFTYVVVSMFIWMAGWMLFRSMPLGQTMKVSSIYTSIGVKVSPVALTLEIFIG